ncbi:MAG: PD-(D/E)XK nuclease family protein [Patescibacteria group bacterium]
MPRNLFDPKNKKPFKLSRTKLEDFVRCPRCFYLDRRLGISKPSMPQFNLNIAVDHLLKKEFDIHRVKGIAHPLMKAYKIKAVPLADDRLDEWRNNFRGIQYFHKPTNLIIFGAIDDIWLNSKGELMIVDYKSTSTENEVTLEGEWKAGYKRQVEIYQWLFRKNGFKVSDTGYFVYANGRKDRKAFDARLEFDVTVLPYKGNDQWVSKAIRDAHKVLMSNKIPAAGKGCEYCLYRRKAKRAEK